MTEESDALGAMDKFYRDAYSLINSKEARSAFDMSKEPEKIKERYGKNQAGQRMLLARRLVESGVRFVSLTYGGWDMHQNIEAGFNKHGPDLDKAFATLISDLDERGMLDSTLVMMSSEFGRTPKINKDNGRDHYPKVFSVALAGGGITGAKFTDPLMRLPQHRKIILYPLRIWPRRFMTESGLLPTKN